MTDPAIALMHEDALREVENRLDVRSALARLVLALRTEAEGVAQGHRCLGRELGVHRRSLLVPRCPGIELVKPGHQLIHCEEVLLDHDGQDFCCHDLPCVKGTVDPLLRQRFGEFRDRLHRVIRKITEGSHRILLFMTGGHDGK